MTKNRLSHSVAYVYALLHPKTLSIRYIGKSINPKRRFANHLVEKKLNPKSIWIQKLRLSNLKPILKIICKCKLKNIDKMEKYFITKLSKNRNLLNCRSGGDGWNLIIKANFNSEKRQNSYTWSRKPVIARNVKTKKERHYASLTQCAEALKTDARRVCSVLKKKKTFKTIKGFFVRYANEPFIEPVNNVIKWRVIYRYNLKSDKFTKFKSVKSACAFGYNASAISQSLLGFKENRIIHKGCIWINM